MKIVLFYHSLVSDWNHGNAHFLRGIATELIQRGHDVEIYEPAGGWSRANLVAEHGEEPLRKFSEVYPRLSSMEYRLEDLDLETVLADADLVLVHEWNAPELVAGIGEVRARNGRFRLLFHDTHHRMLTAREQMAEYDLRHYDGVLAYGQVLTNLYLETGWTRRAWTWHEAADIRVFRPLENPNPEFDLIWIGNWGDGERALELQEFLMDPVRSLGLSALVHGVRYPRAARDDMKRDGIEFRGWLANFDVPSAFANARVTVHIPRAPYVAMLRGIPTIRPFEAMACGIPLVSSPWTDAEGLFRPGRDFLVARDGGEMHRQLERVFASNALAEDLAMSGLETIHARHTCRHRVDELLEVHAELEQRRAAA